MEQIPHINEHTPEQIAEIARLTEEIARIDKLIIKMQDQPAAFMETKDFDLGGDADSTDEAKEIEMNSQDMDTGPGFGLAQLQHQKLDLEAQLSALKH